MVSLRVDPRGRTRVGSDTGLMKGREMTFDYALVPHVGGWGEAGIYRAGREFNEPLIASKAAVHDGPLPARWGWMEARAVIV